MGCMRNLNYWMTSKRYRPLNIRDLRQDLTLFVYLRKAFHSQEKKHLPANRCWNYHKFQPNKKSKSTPSTFSGGCKPHEATGCLYCFHFPKSPNTYCSLFWAELNSCTKYLTQKQTYASYVTPLILCPQKEEKWIPCH